MANDELGKASEAIRRMVRGSFDLCPDGEFADCIDGLPFEAVLKKHLTTPHAATCSETKEAGS